MSAASYEPALPFGRIGATLVHRGDARQIALQIPSDYTQDVMVKVRTYAQDRSVLGQFSARLKTKQPATIASRGPYDQIRSVRVTCCQ